MHTKHSFEPQRGARRGSKRGVKLIAKHAWTPAPQKFEGAVADFKKCSVQTFTFYTKVVIVLSNTKFKTLFRTVKH
jgi:hypothetical protein